MINADFFGISRIKSEAALVKQGVLRLEPRSLTVQGCTCQPRGVIANDLMEDEDVERCKCFAIPNECVYNPSDGEVMSIAVMGNLPLEKE